MHSNPLSRRRPQQASTSTTSANGTIQQSSTKLRLRDQTWTDRPKILRLACPLMISSIGFLCCIVVMESRTLQSKHDIRIGTYAIASESDRCGLQDAFRLGDFWVGSHRSLVDSHWPQAQQPTCLEGLRQLYAHHVHYLDLDLIYDPTHRQLVVAHPMEFAGTTHVYSPCAKLPLETVLQLLDQAMPQSSWFVSLEPKADWDRTHEANSVLQEPMVLLEQTLAVVQRLKIQPAQCTYYIDANKVQPQEMTLVADIANHCSMALAMKRQDHGETLQKAEQLLHYEYLMPTIEFHPTHPNYLATTGADSLRVVQQSIPNIQSVYWIVDTAQDLERVAQLRQGFHGGIVSNRPLEMVRILTDQQYNWCPKQLVRSSAKR